MKTIIYLKGNEKAALKMAISNNNKRIGSNHYYKEENIIKAIEELSKANLRYNTKNGTVYISREWVSKPTNKKDIEKYDDIEDVIKWEFINQIMNGASRLERGFKAIG